MRACIVITAFVLAAGTVAASPIERAANTLERDGTTMIFPAVLYRPPAATAPVADVCAQMASRALGVAVDPARDLLAETRNRVIFRDPTNERRVLKIYRPDRYDPVEVAKMIQRDLAVQTLLIAQGLRVAALDDDARLIERGVLRQAFVSGTGVDKAYPDGYRIGANPSIDRVLATVATIDGPLRAMVSIQTGLLFANTVDCRNERFLGVDLGHCYGNIVLENGTGTPIFVDW